MVLAQGLIAYLITGLVVGTWVPPLDFLAALGALFANILFYLTLTLMLGVLFEHPAPVIGIPMAFLFAQQFLATQARRVEPRTGERAAMDTRHPHERRGRLDQRRDGAHGGTTDATHCGVCCGWSIGTLCDGRDLGIPAARAVGNR